MIKMKYTYWFFVLWCAVAMSSCSGSDDVLVDSHSGMVVLKLQMPETYTNISSRASAITRPEFEKAQIYTLDRHNTLWLFVKDSKGVVSRQGYLVNTDTKGAKALYPCPEKAGAVAGTVDIDTMNVSTTPLYLTPGKYTFSSISPALTIYPNNQFKIKNGEYVVASVEHYTETKSTAVDLTGKKEGIVVLNPMMELGSRLTFTIEKTDNISSLEFIQSGLEIDGLGQEMDDSEYYTVGDSIKAKIGNPYHRLFLKPSQFATTSNGCKYSEISILPVDCRSTMVYIILNLMVNAVPVQYTYAVKNRDFRAGYSHDYHVTIDVKDHITVANWQENSWTYDADPD